METDDSKHLYEVEREMAEYESEGKDDFPHQPMTNLQIHDTISSTGKCSLYILLGIQVVVILILIILLGINGVTLTHLNTVEVCDNTGGGSTGASTSSLQSANQNEQLKNITGILQMLQDTLSNQLLPLTRSQANISSNIYNLTSNTDAKVDLLQSGSDVQMMYILNLTDSIYQILQTTGNTADKLTGIINTLSDLQGTGTSTAGVAEDIFQIVQELLNLQNASSIFNSIRPVSCQDIKAVLPNSPTGYYHVNSRTIYCNMDTLCGSGGGWTRIGYLDMTQATHSCPSSLTLYEEDGYRVCRRPSNTPSCNSIILQSNDLSYSQICGKVTAYQYRAPDAVVSGAQHNNLNSYYLDGVSITRGSPRQHVWSLMVGLFENSVPGYDWANCPCATGSPQSVQSFIGNNYFCESGNPTNTYENTLLYNDVLWDGQSCGSNEGSCCSAPGQPWFHRDYGINTTDYVELRVCGDEGWRDEDVMLSEYEIYIK